MRSPTEELTSVTLSLNTTVPDTPMFSELMDQRGGPLPEFDPWDPDFMPRLDLGKELHALVLHEQEVVAWGDELAEQLQGIAADIESLHYQGSINVDALYQQACVDLKLTPSDEAGFHVLLPDTAALIHQVVLVDAGIPQAQIEEDMVVIEARYELPDGANPPRFAIEYDTSEVNGMLMPSRNAMRNSCATCFPRPCDLDNPRKMCRRSAPPVSEPDSLYPASEGVLDDPPTIDDHVLMAVDPARPESEAVVASAREVRHVAISPADENPTDVIPVITVPTPHAGPMIAPQFSILRKVLDGLGRRRRQDTLSAEPGGKKMDVGGLFDTELDAAVRLARFGDYFPLMKNDLEPAMVMRDDLESSTVAAEGTTYIQQVGNLSWHEPEDCTQTGLCTPDACAMCTGTANCPASTHVRGCFADTLDIAGPVPSLLKATHRARAELAAVEANGSNQNCDNTSLPEDVRCDCNGISHRSGVEGCTLEGDGS
jgi:hypothetical protein